jgi:D-xylose transport system permease protein
MTRFGRYVYGYGGNPEAAQLAGVPTKRVVTIAFAIIGALTAIGAVITTARLNAAPLSIGQLLELQAIAACVIGGTSLAGGSGSIFGAIIGATGVCVSGRPYRR